MRTHRLLLFGTLILATLAVTAQETNKWISLFDGKTLTGWVQRGGKALYRIEDDCIVGSTVPKTENSFLCTDKDYSNFVLEYDVKVDPQLNSGVQIRSESTPDYKKGRVHGYQVEIDPSPRAFSGGIYDEGHRGWLQDLKDNEAARKAFRPNAWNHFKVEAVGDSIKTWVNDVPAANLNDSMTTTGFIGLQVHTTTSTLPLEVRWKNIKLKELTSSQAVASPAHSGSSPAAPNYDTIIRNGKIIDGTGNPWFRGDVAIKDGRIAAIGVLDPGSSATEVIDAAGRFVTPGFIDVHTHCEGDLLKHPEAENFVRMGVTSVIMGNCGDSYLNLAEGFTSHTKTGIGLNVGSLIGHNPIRRKVMGNVDRDPSTTELAAMRDLVEQGMKDGAMGLSTGLIYTPGLYAKTPEIVALAEVAARYNGLYATHQRSEGVNLPQSIDEALTVGLQNHMPVEISHLKISAPVRFGQSKDILAKLEKARADGLDVTWDQYVYAASSTAISIMMPDWANEGTRETVMARLKDPATRKRIAEGMIKERRDDAGRKDLSYAHVSSFRADPTLNGKNILEIAKLWKNDTSWEAQADTVLDIISSGGASMVYYSMDENDVRNFACNPNTMFACDSGVREFGVSVPHPRGYGNNARVLTKYVRDEKLLRLEDAIRKMTSLPANRFRLFDRGTLRPGAAADMLIFDLDRVIEATTFEKPHAYAEGMDYVLVNGKPVIQTGKLTGTKSGVVLKGPATPRQAP